jgi:hypothetical protein
MSKIPPKTSKNAGFSAQTVETVDKKRDAQAF